MSTLSTPMSLSRIDIEDYNMADKRQVIYNPFPEPAIKKNQGFITSPATHSDVQSDSRIKISPGYMSSSNQ